MRHLIAVSCVIALCTWQVGTALGQYQPKGTPLSGAEMKALYTSGVVLDWENLGNKGSIGLLRGGNALLLFVASGGTGMTDKGKWRIAGDTLCVQWEFSNHGEEYCVRHYAQGGDRYESRNAKDGTLRGPFTLRK